MKIKLSKNWKEISQTLTTNKQIEFLADSIALNKYNPSNNAIAYILGLIFNVCLMFIKWKIAFILMITWYITLGGHLYIYYSMLIKFKKKWINKKK